METNPQNGNRGGGDATKGADVDNQKPHGRHMIPVWFFVGVILLAYGLIILGSGIYEFSHPPDTVLANLHPAVWWGALLTVVGAIYVYFYLPKKT